MLVMMQDGMSEIDHPACDSLPERAARRTHLRMLPGSCAVFTPLTPSQSAPDVSARRISQWLVCCCRLKTCTLSAERSAMRKTLAARMLPVFHHMHTFLHKGVRSQADVP